MGYIKVSHITGSKVEIVNGEHQLEMADPKTHGTLRLTFPTSIYDAVTKYMAIHRRVLLGEGDCDLLMLSKNGHGIGINTLSNVSVLLVNEALAGDKHVTSTGIRKSVANRTVGMSAEQERRQ